MEAAGTTAARGDGPSGGSGAKRCVLPAACTGEGMVVFIVLFLGALLGLALPAPGADRSDDSIAAHVSGIIGWMYTLAWSVSFYPQIILNFQRKSVVGLSLDYTMLNLVGFACYFAFDSSLFFSEHIKEEYREAHGGKRSTVQVNDVVFAGQAELATLVTLLQILVYWDYAPLQSAERLLRRAVLGSLVALCGAAAVVAVAISLQDESYWSWLDYLTFLSQVKVIISLIKYLPQVWMNYRRRSTEGWSIINILLDFSGGSLSMAQLFLDSWRENALSGITGNLAKLLLGSISVCFDVVFMVQHYCLYRHRIATSGDRQRAGLLSAGQNEAVQA